MSKPVGARDRGGRTGAYPMPRWPGLNAFEDAEFGHRGPGRHLCQERRFADARPALHRTLEDARLRLVAATERSSPRAGDLCRGEGVWCVDSVGRGQRGLWLIDRGRQNFREMGATPVGGTSGRAAWTADLLGQGSLPL